MLPSLASENLASLFTEIHTIAAHLKHARQPFRNQEEWPSGVRSVLLVLGRNGALTVPEIARERNTSRQNIQIVVNRLKRAGLVDLEINPAHKRSALFQLTENGKALLKNLEEAETGFQKSLLTELSPEDLASTTKCLRKVRHLLAGNSSQRTAKKQARLAPGRAVEAEAPPEEDGFPLNLL